MGRPVAVTCTGMIYEVTKTKTTSQRRMIGLLTGIDITSTRPLKHYTWSLAVQLSLIYLAISFHIHITGI